MEYSTEKNWLKQLSTHDWLCILVVNEKARRYIDEVSAKLLLQNVSWVCTIGRQSEWAHDLLDEEITFREAEQLYLPPHDVMTTWHPDFEEGLWFALFAAYDEEVVFRQVVILDMTKGEEKQRIHNYLSSLKLNR